MKAILTKKAEKCFKNLPDKIKKKTIKQIGFLQKDLFYPSLKTKRMQGLSRFEARIDLHYRFTFIIENDSIYVLSLGPHDEGLGKK